MVDTHQHCSLLAEVWCLIVMFLGYGNNSGINICKAMLPSKEKVKICNPDEHQVPRSSEYLLEADFGTLSYALGLGFLFLDFLL